MNEQNVKIVLSAEDKTGPGVNSAKSRLNFLQKDVSGLATAMGAAAVTGAVALGAALYSAGKAAAEAEVQVARIDATLKAMGASAVKNREAILAAGEAAVKLGFDDEDAAESITKLYQRTNDLTKAQELSNLAMDLARAKNIELSQATEMVGLVLSGNARALKAYGIELDETKTPLQALGELHKIVGGQADQFAGTFQGRMQTLSIQMQNFKETVGGALLEAVMPFVTQLSQWAARPDVQKKITEIAKMVGEFAAVVLPVAIETLKIWYHLWQDVVEVLGTIIFRITQAIEAIGRFVSATKKIGGGVISGVSNFVGDIFRADGGPVSAGSPYIVGERGPEMFVPSSMGSIVPNHALAGAGGGITINITGNTLLDGDAGSQIADQIMRVLKSNLRI